MWKEEFDEKVLAEQRLAAIVLGCVIIPSPIPAVGLIFVGKTPVKKSGCSPFYVRVVQFPRPGVILSHYFSAGDLKGTGDLRALRTYEGTKAGFTSGEDLVKLLDEKKAELEKNGAKPEIRLEDKNVAYVVENAHVHVSMDFMGVASKTSTQTETGIDLFDSFFGHGHIEPMCSPTCICTC